MVSYRPLFGCAIWYLDLVSRVCDWNPFLDFVSRFGISGLRLESGSKNFSRSLRSLEPPPHIRLSAGLYLRGLCFCAAQRKFFNFRPFSCKENRFVDHLVLSTSSDLVTQRDFVSHPDEADRISIWYLYLVSHLCAPQKSSFDLVAKFGICTHTHPP